MGGDDDDDDGLDPDAKHDEFVIGEVATVRPVKKQKGFFLCEVDAGGDDNVSVVTSLRNLHAGLKVILANEGSTVLGKEVVSSRIHGEWNAGVICSSIDMAWKSGDPFEAVELQDEAGE